MGNVFAKKLTSRQKTGRVLGLLPNWFFEPTSRLVVNPLEPGFSEKHERKRRRAITCYDNHANNAPESSEEKHEHEHEYFYYGHLEPALAEDVESLKSEVRWLREEILNIQEHFVELNEFFERSSTPVKHPPSPPISPEFEFPKLQPRGSCLLEEITSTKLRATKIDNYATKRKQSELHEILQKRFSDMHSPLSCVIYNDSLNNSDNNQKSFNSLTLQM